MKIKNNSSIDLIYTEKIDKNEIKLIISLIIF